MTSAAGMPCPVCRVSLVMSERQGVEIDYCPNAVGFGSTAGNSIRSSSEAPKMRHPLPQYSNPPFQSRSMIKAMIGLR